MEWHILSVPGAKAPIISVPESVVEEARRRAMNENSQEQGRVSKKTKDLEYIRIDIFLKIICGILLMVLTGLAGMIYNDTRNLRKAHNELVTALVPVLKKQGEDPKRFLVGTASQIDQK